MVHIFIRHEKTRTGAKQGGQQEDAQPDQNRPRGSRDRHGFRLRADAGLGAIAVDAGQTTIRGADGVALIVKGTVVTGEGGIGAAGTIMEGSARVCVCWSRQEEEGHEEAKTEEGQGRE